MEIAVAFDVGDKRVGVAFSDPFMSYAIPSDTYFRTGDFSADVAALADIAKRAGATVIVCGLPLNRDGTESVQSEKTRRFAEALGQKTGLPVVLQDERYTTRAAREDLVKTGVTAKRDKAKKRVDSLAAAYILESWLASSSAERGRNDMKEQSNHYDEDENIVELTDDEGNTYRYEHLLTFEYKGEWFCALAPEFSQSESEDEAEEDEVAIYRITGEENDESLETIEDDAFLEEVFAEFCEQYNELEDAEEASLLDGDEGDGGEE